MIMSEEVSGGPLTGPKVEPLTDAELVYVAQNLDAMGTNLLRATVGRLLATIADRDAQIAVLADRLKYYGHFVGLKLLPTSAKALLERVETLERQLNDCGDNCEQIQDNMFAWKANAEALQARISELSRTQRTPAPENYCQTCGLSFDRIAKASGYCEQTACPIRTQEKSSQ